MKKKILGLMIFSSISLYSQIHNNPFAVNTNPDEKTTFINPVLPGFYSDPSVCKVGEDYYMVTSTFEYFLGVPVFHSKDLVNWEQIGHCIDREEQMPAGINVFAATIRYNKGIFYMITTNLGKGGNFYMTATNPSGPWSNPMWIAIPGIDPDLFFDDNGKAYVISSHFIVYEINVETGKLLTEGRKVWFGTGGRFAEAPHIYKKDGFYYLLAAEGGTQQAHSVTIARSNAIWGPYTENPANPILTHSNAAGQNSPIQGVGHADIIQAHDNSWWMVFHGYRKAVGFPVHHVLGRETCLAPVTWPKNGWPVINGNGTITDKMSCPTLPLKPFAEKWTREEFDKKKIGLEWNFIQPPKKEKLFYEHGNGVLILKGQAQQIGEKESPAFIGRRLQHPKFTATTNLKFNPENDNELAGITLLNNGQHFDLLVKKSGNQRIVYAELHFGSITYKSKEYILKPGTINLRIEGKGSTFSFSYSQDEKYGQIENVDSRYLSSETVGWFTGVYVGLYSTGKGKKCGTHAEFDYFEYKGN